MEDLSLRSINNYEEYQVQLVLEKLTSIDQNIRPEAVPGMLMPPVMKQEPVPVVPKITLREGLRKFAEWYKVFYCK